MIFKNKKDFFLNLKDKAIGEKTTFFYADLQTWLKLFWLSLMIRLLKDKKHYYFFMDKEKFFISSSLGHLAELLGSAVLKQDLLAEDFFEKKYIIVPNAAVKQWLLQKFVQEKTAVLGLEFIELKSLGSFLAKKFFRSEDIAKLPSFLELKLTLIKSLQETDDPQVRVLMQKEGKKKEAFLEEAAMLFWNYGFYLDKKDLSGWQKTVFLKTGWSTFLQELRKEIIFPEGEKISFYLFGLSYLQPLLRELFVRLSLKFKVCHFMFSPCQFFWEDQLSEKDKKKIRRNYQNREKFLFWENFLKQQNFLLANFGKLMRENLKNLDPYEKETIETYPQLEKSPENFLQTIQQDLISLKADEKKTGIEKELNSLQVHEAPSRLREVEILKDEIYRYLDQGIKLSEIAVFAPQIDKYLPHVKMVFKKDIPCSFLDVQESFLKQGLLKFFQLMEKEFSKADFFELLNNPAFQKAQNINHEELLVWQNWADRLNLYFGIDEKDVEKKTAQKWPYQSFYYGLQRLAVSFALKTPVADYPPPLSGLSMAQAESLEKFLHIFNKLEKVYRFLQNSTVLSLALWADFLSYVADFFKINKEKNEERACLFRLEKFIAKLKAMRVEGTFLLQDFLVDLKKDLENEKGMQNFSEIEVLQFSSLAFSPMPKKVICILGLNENFPRQENFPDYSLLHKKRSEGNSFNFPSYIPLQADEDRFNFLAALFSAEKSLSLSFVGISEEDGKKALPSLVLQDFLLYLDNSYHMQGKSPSGYLKQSHPALAFDRSYFSELGKRSYSHQYYQAAQNFYGREKQIFYTPVSLEKNIFVNPTDEKSQLNSYKEEKLQEIEIKDLWLLANNPLKFHLQKNLGIYLENETKTEPFKVDNLDLFFFRQKALKEDIFQLLDLQERQGFFPPSLWKDIVQKKLLKEAAGYLENLQKLGLQKEDFFQIELQKGFLGTALKKQDNLYSVAPIQLTVDQKRVVLTGRLESVCPLGLVLHGKQEFAYLLKAWPKILIFLNVQKKVLETVSKQLFLTKKPTVLDLNIIDAEKALVSYIKYYFSSLESFHFLYQDLAKPLLQQDGKNLQKALHQTIANKGRQQFQDPYFEWLKNHSFGPFLPSSEKLMQEKSSFLAEIFYSFKQFEAACRS